MQLLKKGKTKDVYDLENGHYLLQFKDTTTVDENGNLDPGGNVVGPAIDGLGMASLSVSKYYFEKINDAGMLTHYVDSDLDAATMTVRPASLIGKGLEVICRLKAAGSFRRRYGDYCAEGQDLNYLIEVSLKDDERGDPFITQDTLAELGVLRREEYEVLKTSAIEITKIIRDDLADKGLSLYDIKLEFARIDEKIALVDEFSWGVMRVYKNGEWLQPFELSRYFAENGGILRWQRPKALASAGDGMDCCNTVNEYRPPSSRQPVRCQREGGRFVCILFYWGCATE